MGNYTRRNVLRGMAAVSGTTVALSGTGIAMQSCEATIQTNATTDDGDPLLEIPTGQFTLTGGTTCEPEADVEIRLQSETPSDPFVLRLSATVEENGDWSASGDEEFSDRDVGTEFTATVEEGTDTVSESVSGVFVDGGQTATATPTPDETASTQRADIQVDTAEPTVGQAVTFDASESTAIGDRTIITYDWTFSEDEIFVDEGPVVTHTFSSAGSHTARLHITDSAGETFTTSREILVGQSPTATPPASSEELPVLALSGAVTLAASVVAGAIAYSQFRGSDDGTTDEATDAGTAAGGTESDEEGESTNETTESDDKGEGTDETAQSADETESADETSQSDAETGDTGEMTEPDDTGDPETTEPDTGPSVSPDTPASRFADDVAAVTVARTVERTGPVHIYDGLLEDGQDTRIFALSQEHADSDAAQQFTQLVERWAGISQNQHIADVYESGTEPRPWVATGTDDRWLRAAHAEMDRDDCLRTVEDVAEALNTAGLYNVSHGSISPETVLLTGEGSELTALLTDWGLSQHIGAPQVTPYTAPEQLDGETTATTDIYRLGLLAYWLLTGAEPFADAEAVDAAIRDGDLTPPSEIAALPESLDEVIATATATIPERRYDSVTELRDAISRALA